MSTLGKLWAGKLFGTNTGNVFLQFDQSEGALTGTLRFLDDRLGTVVYAVTGKFDGSKLEFHGNCTKSAEGIQVGDVRGEGDLTSDGLLKGTWSSTLGTGGTFHLFPHDAPPPTTAATDLIPEQLHTATRQVGALRLYADDVRAMIGSLARDFKQGRVIATYRVGGSEVSKYANDFVAEFERLAELRYLKLAIQEPEAHGINRFASIELNPNGSNEIRVQGIQQSWVLGKAEALASDLQPRQKILATSFRKFGLNINGILLVLTAILLPDLSLSRRFILVAVVVGVASLVYQLHVKFIPNVLIHLSEQKPGPLQRAIPQIVSWLIAATSALIAAIAYGLLKGELPPLAKWFGL
jgi:hypothetical protein